MSYLNDGTLFVSARRALADAKVMEGKKRSELLTEVQEMITELKQRADDVAEDDAKTGATEPDGQA